MEVFLFWLVSILIVYTIIKLHKRSLSHQTLDYLYIILIIYIGSLYLGIFRNSSLDIFSNTIITFKHDDIVRLPSLVMLFIIIFFGIPKHINHSKNNNYINSIKYNQNIIKTKLQRSDYIKLIVLTVPVCLLFLLIPYTILFFTGGMLHLNNLFSNKIHLVIIYVISSICYFYLFFKAHRKLGIWVLNDVMLTCGEPIHTTIFISDIEKIMNGRPAKIITDYKIYHWLHKEYKETKSSTVYIDGSITLKLKTGYYINLNIHHLSGGSEIMKKIADIGADKIVHKYQYSPEERVALTSRKKNHMISLPEHE